MKNFFERLGLKAFNNVDNCFSKYVSDSEYLEQMKYHDFCEYGELFSLHQKDTNNSDSNIRFVELLDPSIAKVPCTVSIELRNFHDSYILMQNKYEFKLFCTYQDKEKNMQNQKISLLLNCYEDIIVYMLYLGVKLPVVIKEIDNEKEVFYNQKRVIPLRLKDKDSKKITMEAAELNSLESSINNGEIFHINLCGLDSALMFENKIVALSNGKNVLNFGNLRLGTKSSLKNPA